MQNPCVWGSIQTRLPAEPVWPKTWRLSKSPQLLDYTLLGEREARVRTKLTWGPLKYQVEGAMTSPRSTAGLASPAPGAAADSEQAAEVPCEAATRAGNPDLGGLVFHATGTVDGDDVVVLAFDVPPRRYVYVLSVDGCAIKNAQTYSP